MAAIKRERDFMRVKKISKSKKKEACTAYIFLLPLLAGVVMFFIIPIIQSFYYSLTDYKGIGSGSFIGLKNYITLFTNDIKFMAEARNTLVYVFGSIPVTIFLALLIANLLNSSIRGVGIYRVIYFLPNVMMGAVVAMVWKWLLNSRYGLLDAVLDFLFGIRPAWLSDTSLTMFSMCMISVWSGLGYCIVIILAGLQSIGTTYYEAAKIDGANAFQRFTHITFPMVTPTIFFLLITRIIAAFNQFDLVYMLGGEEGPVQESIRTLVFGIFKSGFTEYRMGYASAKAVILFLIIMIITFFQFLGEKKWVNY